MTTTRTELRESTPPAHVVRGRIVDLEDAPPARDRIRRNVPWSERPPRDGIFHAAFLACAGVLLAGTTLLSSVIVPDLWHLLSPVATSVPATAALWLIGRGSLIFVTSVAAALGEDPFPNR